MTLESAACRGADPRLFDYIFGEHVFTALAYCARCNVRPECEDHMQPKKNHYDGVVAGQVWRNGASVEPTLFEVE